MPAMNIDPFVTAALEVLSKYPAPGGNFHGDDKPIFSQVPLGKKAELSAALDVAFSGVLLRELEGIAVKDAYMLFEFKLRDKIIADLAKEAAEAEAKKKGAELLAGKTPEEIALIKASLMETMKP